MSLGPRFSGDRHLLLGAGKPGPYIWAGVIGLVVLVTMIGAFALIMRSEHTAESIGRLIGRIVVRLWRGSRTVNAQILCSRS